MSDRIPSTAALATFPRRGEPERLSSILELGLLLLVFFAYAGAPPPMVNEAHYLLKAKNFWDPQFCANDLLASSAKAHWLFYVVFGYLTKYLSLEATAWVGRLIGWTLIARGLQRLSWNILGRPYMSIAVAVVWIAGVEYGNLAGEWVLGGIEAKVPAYGFVLMALAELVRRQWNRVWVLLGAASAFHVLTGGWGVVAAAIAWWCTERGRVDRCKFFTPSLFIGGAIALLGLVPALALTIRAGSEGSIAAARIYTYYRISHHLLPANFFASWYVRHGVLLVATLWSTMLFKDDLRLRRLGAFTLGAVSIAGVGLLIGLTPHFFPDLAARLLRYYWFRLTDAAVPLMLGVCVAKMLLDRRQTVVRCALFILALSALLVTYSSYRSSRLEIPPSVSNDLLGYDVGAPVSEQQKVYRDWVEVCRWAETSSNEDAVFLTPRHQQSFKWYAGRGEVVNWKDVPQDAESLQEWYRRFQEIFPQRLGHVRVTIQYAALREYRQKYGVQFMIVDRRITGENLPLVRLYPREPETNSTFAVYELPTTDSP